MGYKSLSWFRHPLGQWDIEGVSSCDGDRHLSLPKKLSPSNDLLLLLIPPSGGKEPVDALRGLRELPALRG